MKLEIDYKRITNSPYQNDTNSFFSFTDNEVEGFVNLISKMNESSYYISGYRGVGKTSFIKKVEDDLSKIHGFIFIHVPVAKYDKYEILIRTFIRQFYIQFVENKLYEKYKSTCDNDDLQKLANKLEVLHKQTFFELNNEKTKTIRSETIKVKKFTVDIKEWTLLMFSVALTLLAYTVDFSSDKIYRTILQCATAIATFFRLVKIGYNISRKDTNLNEDKEIETELYDDEIAEYRFNSLLKEFKNLRSKTIKPIFIIDELDKLPIKDAKNVLYLFKSTLLSGFANFIVIGGQNLYYELYSANNIEDPILSTLFSNTQHIKLKSSSELRNLFEKLILNKNRMTEEQQIAYYQYIDGLILESRKIPRKFINLIKNDLFFENDKAFIDIPEAYAKPADSELLSLIDNICETINYPAPVKDYISMNLIVEVDKIFKLKTKEELDKYITNLT